jgi:GT2 family glycosyltransferase
MAVYDTTENGRTKLTRRTVQNLLETVDLSLHDIWIVDNNSCDETKYYLKEIARTTKINVISLSENVGTSKAINRAWRNRKPQQHCIKIDNDVEINYSGWAEELEEAISFDPTIGQLGLKRKDLMESPFAQGNYKSSLRMLNHNKGEKWIIVEDVEGVMGTCVLHNWRLIDKVGGLMQPTNYGFDDTLMSIRAKLAGFKCCFLPHIEIDHIDEGGTDYTEWKRKHAGEQMMAFNKMRHDLINGIIPLKCEL